MTRRCFPAVLSTFVIAWYALAGTAATQTQTQTVDRASIEQRVRDLDGSSLSQVDKDAARKAWREALTELQKAESATRESAEFEQLTREAPNLLAKTLAAIERGFDVGKPTPAGKPTLESLEVKEKQADAAKRVAEQEVVALTQEAERRKQRIAALPAEIEAAKGALRKAETSVGAKPADANAKPIELATYDLALAKREFAKNQVVRLEAELRSYTARSELLPKQQELAGLRATAAAQLAQAWSKLVAKIRKEQTNAAEGEEMSLANKVAAYPKLRAYQAASQRVGEQSRALALEAQDAEKRFREGKDEVVRIRRSFDAIRKRLRAGLSDAVGLLLRRELQKLVDPDRLRYESRRRHERIAELEYDKLIYEAERDALPNSAAIESEVDRLLTSVSRVPAPTREAVRQVVAGKQKNLAALVAEYDKLTGSLWTLDEALRLKTRVSAAFRRYINEHVLWARSIPRGAPPSVAATLNAVQWFLQPTLWTQTFENVLQIDTLSAVLLALALFVLLALLALAPRLRRTVRAQSELVAKESTDRFSLTTATLGRTVALAVPIPGSILLIGVALRQSALQTELSLAVGEALKVVAFFLFPIWVLRHGLGQRGLCATHLRWPASAVSSLRTHLRWYVPIATVALLVAATLERQPTLAHYESLGRIAFVIGALALAVFLAVILFPTGGALGDLLLKHRASWLHSLRWLWYPCVVAVPVVLATLALLGYFYTAVRVEELTHTSIWFLMALVLVNGLLLRWWFVKRRRLAVQQAAKLRAAKMQATEQPLDAGQNAGTGPTKNTAPVDEEVLDLPGLHQHARQLLRAGLALALVIGLYGIWSAALPALRILERVQVWPAVRIVEVSEQSVSVPGLLVAVDDANKTGNGSPGAPPASSQVTMPAPGQFPSISSGAASDVGSQTIVTLADLGLAAIVLLLTMSLARNLPSLLEITLLRRIRSDTGGRYAITTLARYAVIVVGTMMISGAIGIGWSQLQWLVAALTFGLAFGLQEIFANFVSGLIILFERPVRIGDLVTVSGVTGSVSKIRMRATTITDWDRKELLVPNKAFITNELVNWTLSDAITRIKLDVGVAYGSDTRRAREILLAIAADCEHVLEQPRPKAVFLRFGESSLDLQLRVFIDDMDRWPRLMNEIHDEIDARFGDAGIEIAFPQRDLHIRSTVAGLGISQDFEHGEQVRS